MIARLAHTAWWALLILLAVAALPFVAVLAIMSVFLPQFDRAWGVRP